MFRAIGPNTLCCLVTFSLLALGPACADDRQDRSPAVAGQFYPGDPGELKAMVDGMLRRAAPSGPRRDPLAIIVPHAGYVFSGEVAAYAYALLDTARQYRRVFVLGPSHRVGFEGAAVYVAGDFVTPLGRVVVDRATGRAVIGKDAVFSDRTDAHRLEHSVEVQLPFLQRALRKPFSLVPIVIGAQHPETCERIAAVLAPYLNPENLFVISTDLSHYPPYDDAVLADRAVTDGIVSGSPSSFLAALKRIERQGLPGLETAMCGWPGVLTLLDMTGRREDIGFELVRYRNSGDVAGYGDKRRVVGYAALQAFSRTESRFDLGTGERGRLLSIARKTVEARARGEQDPRIDESSLTPALRTPCGAFVTLKSRGDLRGCIGRFDASEPLYEVVREMSVAAATQDPRFEPVRPAELPGISLEISVLTPMRRISSIDELKLGTHGVYIRKGNRSGTFLPQVATETGWTKEEFLGHCARDKAGLSWDGWKDAELYVYEALVFGENEH
jgi:AmmeMemoRadiSam system protein B/AmmeMemoRadiSam system protein A